MVARTIVEGIHHAEQLLAHGAAYEEVMAVLDECMNLPGAEAGMADIRATRLTTMEFYGRSDDDMAPELAAFVKLDIPLYDRAWHVIAACARSARLAAMYLPPLIDELEAALPTAHDRLFANALAAARNTCKRLGVPL